jgi:CheY-like chemotaxis protein
MAAAENLLRGPGARGTHVDPEVPRGSENGKKSVLVFEGGPAFRELLATVLRRGGYAVEEASSGEAALDLVRSERPDLIIADILMQGMRGEKFLRSLLEPEFSEIPVILSTSADDEKEVRTLAEALGVSHFLVKSSMPEEVVRVANTAHGSDQELAGTAAVLSASADDEKEVRTLAEALGISHFLVKPSMPEEIVRVANTAHGSDQ